MQKLIDIDTYINVKCYRKAGGKIECKAVHRSSIHIPDTTIKFNRFFATEENYISEWIYSDNILF